ncbi:MAG: ATP-binding protein [Acidimicrobiales bacterium]
MPDEVRLAIPANPSYITLARMVAAGMASKTGFTNDEVEDLRLAIDELCFSIIGLEPQAGTVELRYRAGDQGLEVHARLDGNGATPAIHTTEFSQALLAALVDEHGALDAEDTEPTAWFRKRHVSSGG